MQAARWDVTLEQGSVDRRVIRRVTRDGVVLPLGAPVEWAWSWPDTDEVERIITATVADGVATLDVPLAATLERRRFTHRLTCVDAVLGGPLVLARGYITVTSEVPR